MTLRPFKKEAVMKVNPSAKTSKNQSHNGQQEPLLLCSCAASQRQLIQKLKSKRARQVHKPELRKAHKHRARHGRECCEIVKWLPCKGRGVPLACIPRALRGFRRWRRSVHEGDLLLAADVLSSVTKQNVVHGEPRPYHLHSQILDIPEDAVLLTCCTRPRLIVPCAPRAQGLDLRNFRLPFGANVLRRTPVYKRIPVAFALVLLLVSSTSFAQSTQLNIPRDSQRASVTQRVGITDITVKYHRPLVKGRAIWGRVVPYGQVWRAGANENTTIAFTDAVSIEGRPLEKGTYGLHMIPNQDQWTIIFSKVNTAW